MIDRKVNSHTERAQHGLLRGNILQGVIGGSLKRLVDKMYTTRQCLLTLFMINFTHYNDTPQNLKISTKQQKSLKNNFYSKA